MVLRRWERTTGNLVLTKRVENVNKPPLRASELKFPALALRQSEQRNCGLCVSLYAEHGATPVGHGDEKTRINQ